MKLRSLVTATLLMGCVVLAQALEIKPYSGGALAEAQKADRPVALHFHAAWCPTCRAQEQAMQSLTSDPALNLTVLVANYDTEKDLKRRFNVRAQSTIVVLRGQKELARLVGESSQTSIRQALKTAL